MNETPAEPIVEDVDDDIVTVGVTRSADEQPTATPTTPSAPKTAASAEESTQGDADQQDGADDDGRREGESQQQYAARSRSKLQKRIDKITADRWTEKGRADAAEAELARLRQQLAGKPSSQPTSGADPDDTNAEPKAPATQAEAHAQAFEREHPKPKSDDFPTYDDYVEAVTDWKTERLDFVRQESAKAEQTKRQRQARVEKVQQNVATFKTTTPDYDEVMASAHTVVLPSTEIVDALQDSEHGAAIAYALVKNPALRQQLAQMSTTDQLKWVGRQEAAREKAATPPSPKPKPVTNVADPIEPVGGPAAHRKSLEEMDTDERIDLWNRQETELRKRGGR